MLSYCAAAYIINPIDKKILLVYHSKFNCWVQPGGKIEEGEIPEDAAVREVYEETGIRVKLLGERFPREDDCIKPLGIQRNRSKAGNTHIEIIYAGVPLSMDEKEWDDAITKQGWFSREKLEDIEVFPDIKITMDYILRTYFK